MGSEIVIEEVTGQRGAVLRLRGPGLPFMGGVSWITEGRVKTKRYPGNALEGTQQVLGPLDAPTEMQGFWRRTQLGRVAQVYAEGGGADVFLVEPDRVWAALDGLVLAQARLRVTWTAVRPWNGESFSQVREGRLVRVEFTPDRAGDIAWKASFDWASRGGTMPKVEAAQSPATNAGADSMTRVLDQIESGYTDAPAARTADAPTGASFTSLGQLESLAKAPQAIVDGFFRDMRKIVSDLSRVGDLAKGLRGMPAGLAASAAGFALDSRDRVNQFADDMTRVPPEETTLDQRVGALVRATNRFYRVSDLSRDLARQAQVIAEQAQAPRARTQASATAREPGPEATVLAVHVVTAADTAQSISRRYYRTPDNAAAIMKANGLPWHLVRVATGTILQIPIIRQAGG